MEVAFTAFLIEERLTEPFLFRVLTVRPEALPALVARTALFATPLSFQPGSIYQVAAAGGEVHSPDKSHHDSWL